eukprot:2995919-Rhodomonas_salina.1
MPLFVSDQAERSRSVPYQYGIPEIYERAVFKIIWAHAAALIWAAAAASAIRFASALASLDAWYSFGTYVGLMDMSTNSIHFSQLV